MYQVIEHRSENEEWIVAEFEDLDEALQEALRLNRKGEFYYSVAYIESQSEINFV